MVKTKVKMACTRCMGFGTITSKKNMKIKLDANYTTIKIWYYIDKDYYIMHINRNDFFEDIEDDAEKRFDTSNYEVDQPFPKDGNRKKVRCDEGWNRWC